jgi:hypothetical protein
MRESGIMTITAAWVRTLRNCEELVFAADSRLSGGRVFDYCPKLLTLSRNDCAIAFAGTSGDAYALMLQLAMAIEAHGPLKRGTVDLPKLKAHAIKIFNSMADSLRSPIREMLEVDVEFLLGGYSWVKKEFELWTIHFDSKTRTFYARDAMTVMYVPEIGKVFLGREGRGGAIEVARVAFGGDQSEVAHANLIKLLEDRFASRRKGDRQFLDYEPFEVIRDMLRAPGRSQSIGGAPQIMKVYQYMQVGPLAVYWPNRAAGTAYLRGRPKLGYENLDTWIFDPDELRSFHPKFAVGDTEVSPVPEDDNF